ncbi:MAG: ribosome hibernation-promoting factor, HPF/YfiA family [Candidatus Saccharimonadales bacterium]
MINNLRISGIHTKVTDDMHIYVDKKIGGLHKYLPRASRESAQVDIKLKEAKSKDKRQYECEVIMKLPKSRITAHRKSSSMLAAIDEVEDNLKNQLKRYKNTHDPSHLQRHVIARFRRKAVATPTPDITSL